MLRLINWLANSVIFPLVPMIAVWALRGVETGIYKFSNISGTDLAFATSMVCVISLVRVKNVGNDPQLQDALSNIFSIGLSICLVLFAITLLYQVQAEVVMQNFYGVVIDSIKNQQDIAQSIQGINPDLHDSKLDLFRNVAFTLSIIIVASALLCNFKYDLDRP